MIKKIASIVLYGILVIAMLTAFVPAAELTNASAATKMPPTPTATKAPTPTQIPGVGPGGKIPVGIILLIQACPSLLREKPVFGNISNLSGIRHKLN